MPDYKNGINLIRCEKTYEIAPVPPATIESTINTLWKVVQYTDGKVVKTYYTAYVYLKPMKIILSQDEKSYWIDNAIAYQYSDYKIQRLTNPVKALYIGMLSKCEDLLNPESLKKCLQDEPKESKKPRKRTPVLDTNQQAPVSTPVS